MRRVGVILSVMAALLVVTAGVALAASVLGTKGNDPSLNGTADKDQVVGAQGNDTLDGRAAADQLYGDSGADTLKGGIDDDYLEGGASWDTLRGDAGNDYLNAVDATGRDDKADGGDGTNDTCVIDATDSVFVNGGFQAIADQAAADVAEANSTCETIHVVPLPSNTTTLATAGV